MNFTLKELLDIPRLRELLESLDEIHSMPSAIIDTEGTVLIATSWQDICTNFHRINPDTEKKCLESDRHIEARLGDSFRHVVYRCPMGLVDSAVPIIIEGKHLGNVFTGQLFLEPPDEEYFMKQARQYGFDESEYLAAMRKVSVFPEEKLHKKLTVIHNITQLLAEQGLQFKRQCETEETLRKSEKRSLAIIEASPVPLAMNDEHGNITFLNKAFVQTLGYTENDIPTLADWWPRAYPDPHYRKSVTDKWQESMEEVKCTNRAFPPFEINIVCKDDAVRTFICSATALEENYAGTHLVFLYDISDRQRAEEKLRKSEEKFRSIVETTAEWIWEMDLNGVHTYSNQRVNDILGYRPEEFIGQSTADLMHVDDLAEVETTFPRLVSEKRGWRGWVLRWLHKDGCYRSLESNAEPILGSNGEVQGYRGTDRDITERLQVEKELQRKSADIEQFLYTVSHDLRSPLVTVKTFLGYLESDMAGNEQERVTQDLQFIHSAADKMKLLLDELLEMTRIERAETLPVWVSVREVLVEVMKSLAGVINERKVNVLLPDNDLMLLVDRPRFCRIWQNLIENAIKYSREGSIPRIELGVKELSGQTVFFVKDNGIGIAPEYCAKIFGVFEKLDPKSPGAGLGLSMIKKIVEKSGGRVWVESEGNDKGSCFFFTLPSGVVQS